MKVYDTDHVRNVVLLGSTKSGKTSLAEAMMFEGGVTTRRGSVEEGNTLSDFTDIEHEKGYSIYLSLLHTEWRGHKINILDTPGNDNFAGEILAGVHAGDTAVMVLNAQHGVEIGTQVLWRYVKDTGKPVILVANQCDQEKSNYDQTVEQAKEFFGSAVVPVQFPYNQGDGFNQIVDVLKMVMYEFGPDGGKPEKKPIPDDVREKADEWHNTLVEAAAENDEELMELYFEKGELDEDEMRKGLKLGLLSGGFIPLFCMSAKHNMGAGRIMGFIDNVAPSVAEMPPRATTEGEEIVCDPNGDTSLFVFKTSVEQHLGEISYFKVRSGTVNQGDDLTNQRSGNTDRFGNLQLALGKKKVSVDKVMAGDIGVAVKIKNAKVNDTFYNDKEVQFEPIEFPQSRIRVAVRSKSGNEDDKVAEALHAIAAEDPTLLAGYRADLKQTILQGQGELQLQNVLWTLKTRFKIEAEFGRPKISYRETVRKSAKADYRHKKQSGGSGQFGEVHILIEPYSEGMPDPSDFKVRDRQSIDLDWGGRLEFLNCIVGGAIDARFIPAVVKGIMETMSEGPLTGSRVRDIRVSLYDGKMHAVDSNEISFKIAASQAFKAAFAAANPMLLEPYYIVEVTSPDDVMGDIMTDLQNRRSIILGMEPDGKFQKIKASVPLAELYKYSTSLRSISQGRAYHSRELEGYKLVPDNVKDDVIKALQAEEGVPA